MTKRAKEPAPVEEIIQAEEPIIETVAVVPAVEPMPAAPSGPSFGQRVGRFFAFLLRLLFILIILFVIGAGLYFGLPLVYQRYILPVQENTTQLSQLQIQQSQNEQALADLQTKLDAIEAEQSQHAQSLTELDGRVSEIETEIAAHTQSLATLEQMQSALQENNDATNAELARQINLLKAMELLSRARLFMYQSNFGLAKQDTQTARDLLAEVQPTAPESLADDVTAVILRLDLTLSNLPNFPVAASDDLDIAWQILLTGVPQVQEAESVTPTPEEVTVTPTLQVTPQPTSTP